MTQDATSPILKDVTPATLRVRPRRVDGREQGRKSIGNDKLLNPQGAIANNSITQAMMTASSVGQSQFKSADVSVSIANGASVGTATVTSGDIILGYYPNSVDQVVKTISISSTTVTVTLNAVTALNPAVVHVVVLHT